MKILAGTTLALVLSVASMGPALTRPALSQTSMMSGGQMSGQIESIDGSTVMVRTPDGTARTYEVDPAVISSLRLGLGSTIQINDSSLMSGEIIRIGPRNALVKLDNGKTENFIVTREGRVTIDPGDRVIITPDQRITRVENYVLGAGDIMAVQPTAATSTTTDTTSTVRSTEAETSTMTTEVTPPVSSTPPSTTTTETAPATTPTVEETQPPVRALW